MTAAEALSISGYLMIVFGSVGAVISVLLAAIDRVSRQSL